MLLTYATCSKSIGHDLSTRNERCCCCQSSTPSRTLESVVDIRDYFEDIITGDVLSRPEVIARLMRLARVKRRSAMKRYRLLSQQTCLVISQAEHVAVAAARRLADPPA
jgi:hypothetical protein